MSGWPESGLERPRGVQGGFDQTVAGFELFLSELDNQDGVLGGQTDGREQSDLKINIVRQAPFVRPTRP